MNCTSPRWGFQLYPYFVVVVAEVQHPISPAYTYPLTLWYSLQSQPCYFSHIWLRGLACLNEFELPTLGKVLFKDFILFSMEVYMDLIQCHLQFLSLGEREATLATLGVWKRMGKRFEYQNRKYPAGQSDEMKEKHLGSVPSKEETAILKLLDEYLKEKRKSQ